MVNDERRIDRRRRPSSIDLNRSGPSIVDGRAGALETRRNHVCRQISAAAARIAVEIERLRHVPRVPVQERRDERAR